MGFQCININIRHVPWEVLKTKASGLGFQHLPSDLENVNANKTMYDPYIIKGSQRYFVWTLHYYSKNQQLEHRWRVCRGWFELFFESLGFPTTDQERNTYLYLGIF